MARNDSCIFCKIIAGEIPGRFAHRDEEIVAVHDVNPQAPAHILVMPVEHAANLAEFSKSASPETVAKLFETAARLGEENGRDGYRAVINTGPEAGQTVDHLHVHVLAGRKMHWPPG
jgi:histidine triad (HIT) family protein